MVIERVGELGVEAVEGLLCIHAKNVLRKKTADQQEMTHIVRNSQFSLACLEAVWESVYEMMCSMESTGILSMPFGPESCNSSASVNWQINRILP